MEEREFDAMIRAGLAARWPGAQALVVRVAGSDVPGAEMRLYERQGRQWKGIYAPWPAVVGKNGVAKRREGEGRSPSGAFLPGAAFGRAEKPASASWPYRLLDGCDRWVDDMTSPFYNRWVRGPRAVTGGAEELAEILPYTHALAVRYNDAAERGRGSAIFLHPWRAPGRGTEGCTAVSPDHMAELLAWLRYDARPVLVQGTEQELTLLMEADWGMQCLPPGWGFVDDYIPDAQMELRYNTAGNFTGRRVPGYHGYAAPMRLPALQALARAAEALRRDGFGIRVFDAYRPQQGTDAMIAWAEDAADTAMKADYYPDIDKADIPGKFVARRSAHRLGGTIDLTLLDWATGADLDMGGPFDFFGELSSFAFAGISSAQKANRARLRDAMRAQGFQPYEREWWHFAYPVEGEGGEFPILPREYCL